jgi:hypothetical protein
VAAVARTVVEAEEPAVVVEVAGPVAAEVWVPVEM